MHEHGEEAAGELRPVQARKFAAFCKALFVYTAGVVFKKVAGNGIYDHMGIVGTGFYVLLRNIRFGAVQVRGQPGNLRWRNIDHERAATVPAVGAIYLGGDSGVQLLYKEVDACRLLRTEKCYECLIFRLLFQCGLRNNGELCDDLQARKVRKKGEMLTPSLLTGWGLCTVNQ